MSSVTNLMKEIYQLRLADSSKDNTLDILARPSLPKITGMSRTKYTEPADDPILIQANRVQRRGQTSRGNVKSHLEIDNTKRGTVTKPRFVRLRSRADGEAMLPAGRASLRQSAAAAPQRPESVHKEFTFTGYDIMTDGVGTEDSKNKSAEEVQRDTYQEACSRVGVVPVSYIERTLATKEIRMRSHGLGAKGTRAIAVALAQNDTVETLDLVDNSIGADGAACLAQMLKRNSTITNIDLSENPLGHEGIASITEAMKTKDNISRLNLSGTDLKDADMVHIQSLLENNIHLLELRLSRNSIGEIGGTSISRALRNNDTLEVLDISWNHLRGKGATAIAKSVEGNLGLKELNLSWNGFAMCCEALGKALGKNKFLTSLDLSANRVHNDALVALLKGLKKNNYLVKLKISSNPITPDVTPGILKTVQQMKSEAFAEIFMEDVAVSEEFLDLLEALQERRNITVVHGPCVHKTKPIPVSSQKLSSLEDPREILFEFLKKEGLRVIDLFKQLDKDNDWSITKEEFIEGLKSFKVPMSELQVEKLMSKMDSNMTDKVDLRLLDGGKKVSFSQVTENSNERSSRSK